MKTTKPFADLVQKMLFLTVMMTMSIALTACSDDNDHEDEPPVPEGMRLTTTMPVGEEIRLVFKENDNPIVKGATEVRSEIKNGFLYKFYKLTEQTITITGTVTFTAAEKLQLTTLDARGNKNLKAIFCQDNLLTSLKVNTCTQLTHLYCENNKLTSLDVGNCTLLKTLICSNNRLTALNASNCTRLYNVGVCNNKLTYENLKLPNVKNSVHDSVLNPSLSFKYTKGDTQKLSPAQVAELTKKGWDVLKISQELNNKEHYLGEL